MRDDVAAILRRLGEPGTEGQTVAACEHMTCGRNLPSVKLMPGSIEDGEANWRHCRFFLR